MNLNDLQNKLLAAARADVPDDRVPYAFEKRIMARLAGQPVTDTLSVWAAALWRAAIPCLALIVLIGATSLFIPSSATQPATPGETVAASTTTLSDEFENTLLADVGQNVSDEEAR